MSHVIRVPSNVFSRLESHASGFDTPVKVIERLLNYYEGVNEEPLTSDSDKGKIFDKVNVTIDETVYTIERLTSGTILVRDEISKEKLHKVKPFLRNLIDELKLDVNPLNSNGNEKNTRQLGKEIMAILQGQTSIVGTGKRKPNTDLPKLVEAGVLDDGQILYLYNYKHEKLKDEYKATISGKGLIYENKWFSMSPLAKDLLQVEGYSSDSVTGPEHWYTGRGVSVKELWDEYLAKHSPTHQ